MADPSEPRIKPDPRVNPWRDDLAAEHLRGEIDAPAYVRGHDRAVIAPVTALRRAPAHGAMMDTQLLLGEKFRVYEERGPWVWGQAQSDDYVGYVLAEDLGVDIATTHRVTALRSFIYTDPDIKSRPLMAVSMGAHVRLRALKARLACWQTGHIFLPAILMPKLPMPMILCRSRNVSSACLIFGAGAKASALIVPHWCKFPCPCAAMPCPRDSDMQEAVLGAPVSGDLARGDLVFWKGHVGILQNADTLLHANATHMCVVSEPFVPATKRIGETAGDIRQIRRMA